MKITTSKVFSSSPFEKEGSQNLFKHVKLGHFHEVSELLDSNKYLVYDFDHVIKKKISNNFQVTLLKI
jgi:hypothetical protein